MNKPLTNWDSNPPGNDAELQAIDHFDARGMRIVYGRGDHFGPNHKFHMAIWMTRSKRLMMRFWSYCQDIDGRSFEIKGLNTSDVAESGKKAGFQDSWVPHVVRNAYDQWIEEEF